jgi:hypothetical protein
MSLKSTYDGKLWKIYYFDLQSSKDYKTSDLEANLPDALKFLDSLSENEEVLAIIPDTGTVDTLLAGIPATGVTGFAIVVRKKNSDKKQ